MKKRILCLVIISALLAVFIPAINAEDKTDNEQVTLIVEVAGEAALETDEAVLMGAAEYNETDKAAQHTEKILSVQEHVKADIKNKVNKKTEFGFTYTNLKKINILSRLTKKTIALLNCFPIHQTQLPKLHLLLMAAVQ